MVRCSLGWRRVDRKSTSGAFLAVNGRPIAWSPKKQAVIAMFTMEAEFIAGATSVSECGWIRQILQDLLSIEIVPGIMADKQSAIRTMKNEMLSAAANHIAIRYHFIKDETSKGRVSVKWCASKDQLADILTKPLPRQTFEELRCKLPVAKRELQGE